jgi:G3E family GTPase
MLNNSPYVRKVELQPLSHQEIVSVHISVDKPLDIIKFDHWLKALMGNHFGNIMRVKGFVFMEDFDFRIVIQGVQNIYVSEKGKTVSTAETKQSSLVFIGKKLHKHLLQQGLELCTDLDAELDLQAIYLNIEAIQEQFLS